MFIKKIKEKHIYFYLLFSILLLFSIYIFINKKIYKENFINDEENKEISNPVQYKNLLIKNIENGVLTKMKIKSSDVQREDCPEKCGEKDCQIMFEQKRNLDDCNKCHKNSKKCYKKSITGGNCEDCLDREEQMKCNDVSNFGSLNPNDLFSKNGVDPYFVIKTSFSSNNDMSQECRFSYDLNDLI
jgi:hypothetical protein